MKAIILAAGEGVRFKNHGIQIPKPLLSLGGVSLLERAARHCVTAGFSEILIVIGAQAEKIHGALEARLLHLPVRWICHAAWEAGNGTSVLAAAPFVGQEHFLVIMADHVLFPSMLERLRQHPLDAGATLIAVDKKRGGLSDPLDATKVRLSHGQVTEIGKTLEPYDGIDVGAAICSPALLEALAESATRQNGACSHTDGMRALAAQGKLLAFDIGAEVWEDADSPESLKAAERLLYNSLRKPTDGFMSRVLERRLSLAVTRRVAETSITPNQVTLLVLGVGGLAAFLFAQAGYWPKVLGALLFWCSSFLDGVDGELARLKFMESRLGGWLDLWADNVVHIMVFIGMGVGLWQDTQNDQWITLGGLAALGVLVSVGWVSWRTLRTKRGQGPLYTSVAPENGASVSRSSWSGRLTWLADALSRRDFIFGVIFIAFLQWLPPFLWAAAIGSHIYWIVLLLLARTSRPSS